MTRHPPRPNDLDTLPDGFALIDIAERYGVTIGTVRTYVKNVLAKLGVHSRLQLAALASHEGLLINDAALENAMAPQAS